MTAEFVIGVDSSTQSTKAIAWDRNGKVLGEGRAAIPMAQPGDNHFEQEPDDWWCAFRQAVRELGGHVDMASVRAIAISNQRETIGFLDRHGQSVRPAIVWLDQRAADSVEDLSALLGNQTLHRISGKPVDLTPAVYRVYWLTRHEPRSVAETALFVDVHSYLTGRLTGQATASWTSADPMGLFDINTLSWSHEILAALELDVHRFPKAVAPGGMVGLVGENAARDTGLPPGTPVIAAGGDGQCAGLGVNAVRKGRAYLNLGTALITGAWGSEPVISLNWRTMTSPTGSGYFYEGVLRAGTFLVDWFIKQFVSARADTKVFSALETQAATLPVGAAGVTVSPYLSGSMNPHWSMDASAAILGMRPGHDAGHVYRAILESLTGEVARTVVAMKASGIEIDMVVAVGGGANSALWRSMIADATGLPICVSQSLEASSLGAAIAAATGIGWYPDFDTAAGAMSRMDEAVMPDRGLRVAWDALLDRQDRLNHMLVAEASRR
ncbi:MAG: FGGY family carbohydrate kinase [Rhodobacter sp.]|nr:FGGY family carbohydrate kinase [Rhodobacter sp.]MCY4168051.1 FGGY family carbohydrate kinase [Rhodobacter sp.]MCY4243155.1 FGGY family carbohydrate kinase [Rhodobacter sp.]